MRAVPLGIFPTIAEVVASDESYFRFNGRMLRNAALVNLFDGCALTIPIHPPGEAPVGLMIAGTPGQDSHVLALGLAVIAAGIPLYFYFRKAV